MEELNNDIYYDASSGTLIQFNHEPRKDIGKVQQIVSAGNIGKIKYWGARNHLPQYREEVLMDNNIIGELIGTKRAIILGQGIKPYIERVVDGERVKEPQEMPDAVGEWMDKAEFYDRFLEPASNQLFMHGNIFSEFIGYKLKPGINSVYSKDSKYMRAAEKDRRGQIRRYFYCPDWKRVNNGTNQAVAIPSALFPNSKKFIFHTGDRLFHDGYYCHPAYWGGKEWIELANVIPKFHKGNIGHGYTIRYHIQIPKNYFLDKRAIKEAATDELKKKCISDAAAKKQEFIDKMNQYLAGAENAGRAIFSTYEYNQTLGKEYPGIKIQAIDTKLHDESLLKLYEKSNQANISAAGIHPTLANVESSGKLSSGSEMRNAFNFYVTVKAPFYRKILLKTWRMVLKLQGWDKEFKNYQWGFEDITLEKLDDDKSGTSTGLLQSQNQ